MKVMMMSVIPLRYNISDWHQLPECRSNSGETLSIKVADLIQNNHVTGTRITVVDEVIGILFSYVLNPTGDYIIDDDPPASTYDLSTDQILAILYKFGFFVTYNRETHLSAEQITYLEAVDELGYDKIRWIATREGDNYIVVFNAEQNPNWLDNSYEIGRAHV